MRPKNDDVADALNPSPGEHPYCAAHRRVLEALRELHPDDHNVVGRMENTPIQELGNRTLEETVLAGDAEKALRYLEAISSGWNG